ncbi:S41 family peptidase [Arthrobacter sp. GMC3]|uniref:S41 family peptidase n=1 Tax=Arthrobacter sp. GMC3 TaxID=2058894 RepID=UPI000CE50DFF|nr:S41 family peptidase [Arthrobacter sp. GMC3]
MTSSSYFRYPHVHQDLLTFVAQDDVWVAPLAGGRAWRLSAEMSPPRNPRFTPDGSHVVWSVTRGAAPEVVTAPVDGGEVRQLTYWGHASTKVKGFTPEGKVVVTSAFEQPDSRLTWAYAVGLDDAQRSLLAYGPVDNMAFGPVVGDERPMVLSSALSREPAAWKRYRGGTAGKLWIDSDGSGEFSRLLPELDGNLCDPLWVSGRIAFLSDHEGHGNLYSVQADGSGLRRHTDFEGFYVRHASTDGTRIVFESAGNLFSMASLDDEAVQIPLTLGAAASARTPKLLTIGDHLNEVVPSLDGRASVVQAHGTVHWLTHRDGPARVLAAEPGVRARLARPLDAAHVFYIADNGGEAALYIRSVAGAGDQGTGPDLAEGAPVPEEGPAGTDGEEVTALPRPVSAQAVNADTFREPASPAITPAAGPDAPALEAEVESSKPSRPADDVQEIRRIEFPARTRAAEAVASPDGAMIAVGTEFGEVYLIDVHSGAIELLATSALGAVEELAFSPDSAWLAWSEPLDPEGRHAKLRMAAVTAPAEPGERIVELTDGRFADRSPEFTRDGKYLAFLSRRSFDPVYDTQSFDLSFPVSTKPFLIALAATTPSPFGPAVEGAPHPGSAKTKAPSSAQDVEAKAPAKVTVDVAGLPARIIAVPVPQDQYVQLSVVDGGLLWRVERSRGATGDGLGKPTDKPAPASLDYFDFATGVVSRIVEEIDSFRVSADGNWLVTLRDGRVKVLPASVRSVDEATEAGTDVDLERIMVRLDPGKVWGQAFDEAWRLQRDFFYTPDMAGTDWDAVHARYRPLVERLGSHDDLVDLLWEMHGELGTSHAYVTPAPVTEDGAGSQGYLGAVFETTEQGFVIKEILAGESSDPQAFSPLEAPGVAGQVGEVLEAVNGVPVPAQGPAVLLAGTAGKIIELTLRSATASQPDGEGQPGTRRRVAVVPLKSEEQLRYQQWVARNRATVRQASQGAFGYLHVPDMMPRGWAQLHRDLDTETAADALVIDVRRNRGGHTSQLVAEVISRRMDAWCLSRGHGPEIYPSQALRGPVVILTDEFAGSDGDIITAVAKLRGIGPVVGMRTWGGVVGIDGKFTLADGTGVTQPRYAFWFRDGQGFHVENYGVDPDITVPFPPHDYLAGNDPQLEAAIGVLLEMRAEIPTVQPPELAGYRNVAPAPLPPRP